MMKPIRLASFRHVTRTLGAVAIAAAAALPAMAQAPATPAPAAAAAGSNTLEAIRSRGTLACGVNTGLAGFAQPDSRGVWTGFDVDYCKALAVAIFNDASKVRYVPLTAQSRFTALQSGEIDVAARNTTVTLSRDTSLGVNSAKELNGATVCVQPGTTTEQNLTDWARSNNVQFTPVVIERLEELVGAYAAGRCDAYTTDVSGLAATRSAQPNPADHKILPEVISKEPLGPFVRQGDPRFADIVRWTHYALLSGEEFGITAANVDKAAADDVRPDVQRMLGKNGGLGQMLGLDNAWAARVIKAVGNYGEIFARNLEPIGIQRGPNAQWTKGGLQYAPPFR